MTITHIFELLRLHRPIGFFLLWWPCAWGLLLAGNLQQVPLPHWTLLITLTAGVFFTRTFGCVINDLCDRDIDAKVKRTKNRPLASGALSVSQGIGIAVLLGMGALGSLALLVVQTYVIAGIAAVLIFIYPLAKRYIAYPQFVLALAMNLGLIFSYVAATGSLQIPVAVWLAYLSAAAWTVGYDTVYALQDRDYDRNLNVGSTALMAMENVKRLVLGSYSLSVLALCAIPLVVDVSRNFVSGLILWALFLGWQVFRLYVRNELTYDDLFHSNGYGALFLGLAFGLLV